MQKTKWQLSVSFIALLLGFFLAIQFNSQQRIVDSTPTKRIDDLTVLLRNTQEECKHLEKKIANQKKEIQSADSVPDAKNDEYDRMRTLAGLTAMQGPGIVVNLNVSSDAQNNNLNAVQDEDLLRTVNALKAAGAEAISVNDQRIIASSEIRLAGSNIVINNTAINVPYEIKAIGEPSNLEAALNLENGIIETLNIWGIKVQCKKQDKVEIPPYRGALHYQDTVILNNK